MTTKEELAWAAGFFDGEGHTRFTITKHGYGSIRIKIGQNYRPSLMRFNRALRSLGTLYGPYTTSKTPHVSYLDINGFEKCQAIIAQLWPWLSSPKRTQARSALVALRVYQGTHRTYKLKRVL